MKENDVKNWYYNLSAHRMLLFNHKCTLFLIYARCLLPDGASLLFSPDEASPFLLYSLKEGKDKWILIIPDRDFGLWFCRLEDV